MEKTRIAIIGLGSIAQLVHLQILKKFDNVVISAVAELNKGKLNTVAENFDIENTFTDYKEMLANTDFDALIIATPTGTHKEIALECIKYKKPILIEKPIARTYQEAEDIVKAAEENNVPIMVGMNMRYRPDVMLLKSIINSGDLGDLFYIKCGWLRKQSSIQNWFTQKEMAGGGVILDLGIVLLDLTLWLLNFPKIKTISTQNFFINTKTVEDSSVSYIRTENNSLMFLETSWSLNSERDSFYLELYGTSGQASINPLRVFKKMYNELIDLTPAKSENPNVYFKKSYLNELKHFIGSVKGLNPILSPANEALSRMKIIENMYKSGLTNKEVDLI